MECLTSNYYKCERIVFIILLSNHSLWISELIIYTFVSSNTWILFPLKWHFLWCFLLYITCIFLIMLSIETDKQTNLWLHKYTHAHNAHCTLLKTKPHIFLNRASKVAIPYSLLLSFNYVIILPIIWISRKIAGLAHTLAKEIIIPRFVT